MFVCLFVFNFMASVTAVILEPKTIKSVIVSIVCQSICHEEMGLDAMIFFFECSVLSQVFLSPLSPSSRDSLIPFLLSAIRVVSSA